MTFKYIHKIFESCPEGHGTKLIKVKLKKSNMQGFYCKSCGKGILYILRPKFRQETLFNVIYTAPK